MASAMIAGGIVGAVGHVFKGIQSVVSGKQTSKGLRDSADRTELEAEAAANRIRARSRRATASMRARMAAGGVELSDSAVDVQYDVAQQYGIDADTEIYKGRVRAANLRTQANVSDANAYSSLITSGFGAAGSVLGGFGAANAIKNNPTFDTFSTPKMPTMAQGGMTFGVV